MKELTPPQAKLHAYLCERWNDPPSFQEMADYMGYGGKNAIMGTIKALVTKGYVKRPDGVRSRGIQLLIGPDLDGTTIEIAGRMYRLVSITPTTEKSYARAESVRG